MSEIVWLMDVDQVLNCWEYPDPLIHSDFKTFESGNGYMINYSPSLLKRITDLHDDGVVTVKWLTTWQSLANTHLRETFGFKEDLEVEGGDCEMDYWTWWKFPIARDAIERYERVIWTDDDIVNSSKAVDYVNSVDDKKLIAIATYPCLTHEEMDTIESWINNE